MDNLLAMNVWLSKYIGCKIWILSSPHSILSGSTILPIWSLNRSLSTNPVLPAIYKFRNGIGALIRVRTPRPQEPSASSCKAGILSARGCLRTATSETGFLPRPGMSPPSREISQIIRGANATSRIQQAFAVHIQSAWTTEWVVKFSDSLAKKQDPLNLLGGVGLMYRVGKACHRYQSSRQVGKYRFS